MAPTVAAALGLVASVAIALVSNIWRWADCHTESAPCGQGSLLQMYVAFADVLVFVVALVQAVRSRGRPWRWFWGGVAADLLWGLVGFLALYDFG